MMKNETTMTELSSAAQAVLDAATPALNNLDACGFNHQRYDCKALAAALRAAADQVVPPALEEEFYNRHHSLTLQKAVEIRSSLLAIATELENQ